MFNIVLFNPVMAANAGNVIRLCANNGNTLHLIEPLGFDFEEKKLRRAGLDYHDLTRVERYPDFASFAKKHSGLTTYAITTKGTRNYTNASFNPGDVLLFGSETKGLPPEIMSQIAPDKRLRVPMMPSNRSLNLSNTVAIVSYEAWRQFDFKNGK